MSLAAWFIKVFLWLIRENAYLGLRHSLISRDASTALGFASDDRMGDGADLSETAKGGASGAIPTPASMVHARSLRRLKSAAFRDDVVKKTRRSAGGGVPKKAYRLIS